MASLELIRRALAAPLESTSLDILGQKTAGKVRDCYVTTRGTRLIATTDRISAFDRVLGTLPLKGQLLQWISAFWFDLTRDEVPNHVIRVVDPNVMEVKECAPLGAEMVVRAYVTGVTSTSMWTHYARGERVFCGHRLPDGLRRDQRLERALCTPSSKAPQGEHDVSMSRAELVESGAITAEDFDAAEAMVMRLFAIGQAHCEARGLILVDTKYELGKDEHGRLCVIDEVHTPDSSRFWMAASYDERFGRGESPESFDKEYVRRWLSAQGFTGDGAIPVIPDDVKVEAVRRYVEACETIVGQAFVPDLEAPAARMARNLGI
ncbi:MAG: phosphoribosylaminoimidazolesuccinocarboxamide synthase [Myxococcales bacterium]|nr:phosphoribosylaminoimidazolesuccinocarboxamide synthase [Myxococcales bacterium]